MLVLGAIGWGVLVREHLGWAFVAFAAGVVILCVKFLSNVKIEGRCPACQLTQRWAVGDAPVKCIRCMAAIRIGADATLRELGPDDETAPPLYAFELHGGGGDPIAMPPICAVCGAPPTTTGAVYDTTKLHDRDGTAFAKQLAAIAVPLCAEHAEAAPVEIDRSSGSLTLRSYRFYKAVLAANRLRNTHDAVGGAPAIVAPTTTHGQLEPLLCKHCGAPLAVTDFSTTTCAACGEAAELPEPYRQLRDATRLSDADAAQLQALAADIAKPPPAWKRVAMIVGYVVGGATVLVMALGAVIGAIGGAVAGSKLGDTAAAVLAVIGGLLVGIVAIPYVGEYLAAGVMLHDAGAASDLLNSAAPAFRYDLVAAAVLYGLGVVPIALAYRTQGDLKQIVALQDRLAAPVTAAGKCCRRCGAALQVPRGALVARCMYCSTDNLLTIAGAAASSRAKDAKELDASVQEAVARHARDRRDAWKMMGLILVAGLVLVPYLCAAGWIFHRLFNG